MKENPAFIMTVREDGSIRLWFPELRLDLGEKALDHSQRKLDRSHFRLIADALGVPAL